MTKDHPVWYFTRVPPVLFGRECASLCQNSQGTLCIKSAQGEHVRKWLCCGVHRQPISGEARAHTSPRSKLSPQLL